MKQTIDDLLEHSEAATEIIVVLDGALADPPLPQHPRVTVVYHPVSVGQRAATNEAAKLARGKYVAKIDAHCAFDQGWDRKMLEAFAEVGDDVTMVPVLHNLHAFDWVCPDGHRRFQGPSGPCAECGKPTGKEMVWRPNPDRPRNTAFRFDTTLHFQYHGEWKNQQKGDLVETMSLQGSFFMLARDRYFDLNVCDEEHGSWGQQGTEVACASWLSGGRVICNKRTWYAHLFRTQGGDFGFPYPQSGKQVEQARQYSRDLWLNNKHPKQVRPLSWLVDKFKPLPAWHDPSGAEALARVNEAGEEFQRGKPVREPTRRRKPTKGVILYTHNVIDPAIFAAVQAQILRGIKEKHVVSVSAEPLAFGTNIVKPRVEGWLDLFERVLVGLEASTAEVIFLAEHDVLLHQSHFDFVPPRKDAFYYNTNVWRVRQSDGFAVRVDDCKQLSGLVAYRELLLEHYRERVRRVRAEGFTRGNGFEPGTRTLKSGGYDDHPAFPYRSAFANLDIRHGKNATASRWRKDQFRNPKYTEGWEESHASEIAGWPGLGGIIKGA